VNRPAPHDTLGRWLATPGHTRIARDSADYPALLGAIDDPPEWLYIRGDAAVLHLPCLAIVGSRNPTRGGEQNAYEFARFLGRHGFCIVSGLAAGIDAAAHRGALAAGAATVAFLGHGIDTVYPARHRELADEIASRGALVSEFPLGTPPMKPLFPQRPRRHRERRERTRQSRQGLPRRKTMAGLGPMIRSGRARPPQELPHAKAQRKARNARNDNCLEHGATEDGQELWLKKEFSIPPLLRLNRSCSSLRSSLSLAPWREAFPVQSARFSLTLY
jgi:hypothetical protein